MRTELSTFIEATGAIDAKIVPSIMLWQIPMSAEGNSFLVPVSSMRALGFGSTPVLRLLFETQRCSRRDHERDEGDPLRCSTSSRESGACRRRVGGGCLDATIGSRDLQDELSMIRSTVVSGRSGGVHGKA